MTSLPHRPEPPITRTRIVKDWVDGVVDLDLILLAVDRLIAMMDEAKGIGYLYYTTAAGTLFWTVYKRADFGSEFISGPDGPRPLWVGF